MLANIYLHYVFDLWVQHWRKTKAKGDVIVVRWADDFVVGFQHRADAVRFHQELAERFAKFKLKLHPEKTRVIEFGLTRRTIESDAGKGSPRHSTFLASRTSAARSEATGCSRCCGGR